MCREGGDTGTPPLKTIEGETVDLRRAVLWGGVKLVKTVKLCLGLTLLERRPV